MKHNEYGCDICEERFDWDREIVWVSENVGVCEDCYDSYASEKRCPDCDTTLFENIHEFHKLICLECGWERSY